MRIGKVWFSAGAALLVCAGLAGIGHAQQGNQGKQGKQAKQNNPAAAEVHILHVRGNVYMLVGAGGNITLSVGPDGVLMVDTGLAQNVDKVMAAIRTLTDKPVVQIVNTHLHVDHIGGNEKLAATGKTYTGGNVAGDLGDAAEGAAIIAHENVLNRLSSPPPGQPAVPFRAQPTETYHIDSLKLSKLFHGGEAVQIVHQPAAHTDGDSMVFFRGADVIATGDIFLTESYPIIDLQNGGSINGIIDALNHILDLAFPDFRLEGGTMIVPGHGRLCDSADVAYYRDMATIVRDRIQAMIKKDMTLEQVKAARPTVDYDPRYGSNTGFWTTDMFVEAVYKSLSGRK